ELGRAALDGDLLWPEARLGAEDAAGPPLAVQAVADRDPHGLARAAEPELPAAAGRLARGHGLLRRISVSAAPQPAKSGTMTSLKNKGDSSLHGVVLHRRQQNPVSRETFLRKGRHLGRRQPQAELGAPPEDVLGRARPFGLDQEIDLAPIEVGAEALAEVA